jgi:hypothetical protein
MDEVLFGPYGSRAAGSYRVLVGFEPETSIPCSTAIQAIRVEMAVTASARAIQLAPRRPLSLKPSASDSGHCLMTGELDFSTPALATGIETPVWLSSGVLPVRLTQYTLQRVE